MKQFTAFFKKECMESVRSSKAMVLLIVFVLFGIMNPAIAKLTPWLMETMAESLEDTGLVVTAVTVDALTSWTQYYKNVPMAVIVFLLMFSGIMTNEYQKGTLINMVTKGLDRWKIILSKTVFLIIMWTALYWLCYGITYAYNAYFWDNSIAENVFFAAGCFYIMGIWLISLVVLGSAFLSSNSAVILFTGAVFGICYLLGLYGEIKKYLPIQLAGSGGLLMGNGEVENYVCGIVVSLLLVVVNISAGVVLFNRKNL